MHRRHLDLERASRNIVHEVFVLFFSPHCRCLRGPCRTRAGRYRHGEAGRVPHLSRILRQQQPATTSTKNEEKSKQKTSRLHYHRHPPRLFLETS